MVDTPGSNKPGRHKEDDENLVAGPLLSNSAGHGWRTGAEEAAGNHYVVVDEVAEPITAHNARNATHAGNNARPRNVVAELGGTVTAGHDHGANAGRHAMLVACFDPSQVTSRENRATCDPELASLAAQAKAPAVALALRDRGGATLEGSEELAPALRSSDGGGSRSFVSADTDAADDASSSAEVRRLTPEECERLMGVPDGYTRIPYRPRRRRRIRPASDTVRYGALGNSIATTQLEWIGRKLEEVLK